MVRSAPVSNLVPSPIFNLSACPVPTHTPCPVLSLPPTPVPNPTSSPVLNLTPHPTPVSNPFLSPPSPNITTPSYTPIPVPSTSQNNTIPPFSIISPGLLIPTIIESALETPEFPQIAFDFLNPSIDQITDDKMDNMYEWMTILIIVLGCLLGVMIISCIVLIGIVVMYRRVDERKKMRDGDRGGRGFDEFSWNDNPPTFPLDIKRDVSRNVGTSKNYRMNSDGFMTEVPIKPSPVWAGRTNEIPFSLNSGGGVEDEVYSDDLDEGIYDEYERRSIDSSANGMIEEAHEQQASSLKDRLRRMRTVRMNGRQHQNGIEKTPSLQSNGEIDWTYSAAKPRNSPKAGNTSSL